jgi:hypothetical protein
MEGLLQVKDSLEELVLKGKKAPYNAENSLQRFGSFLSFPKLKSIEVITDLLMDIGPEYQVIPNNEGGSMKDIKPKKSLHELKALRIDRFVENLPRSLKSLTLSECDPVRLWPYLTALQARKQYYTSNLEKITLRVYCLNIFGPALGTLKVSGGEWDDSWFGYKEIIWDFEAEF